MPSGYCEGGFVLRSFSEGGSEGGSEGWENQHSCTRKKSLTHRHFHLAFSEFQRNFDPTEMKDSICTMFIYFVVMMAPIIQVAHTIWMTGSCVIRKEMLATQKTVYQLYLFFIVHFPKKSRHMHLKPTWNPVPVLHSVTNTWFSKNPWISKNNQTKKHRPVLFTPV